MRENFAPPLSPAAVATYEPASSGVLTDIYQNTLKACCNWRQSGASLASMSAIRKTPDVHRLNIRLAPKILKAVDAACEQRAGTVSRNTWIAEAVAEKLARESAKSGANDV